jgi:hypothetical protein
VGLKLGPNICRWGKLLLLLLLLLCGSPPKQIIPLPLKLPWSCQLKRGLNRTLLLLFRQHVIALPLVCRP